MKLSERIAKFFMGRADEINTWFGAFGFVLEIFLHPQPSNIMLILFLLLVIVPQAEWSQIVKAWADKLRSWNEKLQ